MEEKEKEEEEFETASLINNYSKYLNYGLKRIQFSFFKFERLFFFKTGKILESKKTKFTTNPSNYKFTEEKKELEKRDFVFEDLAGSGNFGQVWKATVNKIKYGVEKVAVKFQISRGETSTEKVSILIEYFFHLLI